MKKNAKRLLCSLMCLIILALCGATQVYSVEGADGPTGADSGKLSEEDIPEMLRGIIDIDTCKHIARDYEAEQNEPLSNVIYYNADGSKTMYIMEDPIRYIDANGQIKDKSIKITEKETQYVVEQNDPVLILNKNILEGVVVQSGSFAIKMTPEYVQNRDLDKVHFDAENNTVEYSCRNELIKTKYTPLHNGVKEDIIVSNIDAGNTFSFVIETDGLELRQNELEQTVLFDGEKEVARFGDIVVYDNDGKQRTFLPTVETVEVNTKYRFVIEIDTEYFYDTETAFPLTIDPTITLCSGFSGIEHAMLYENYGNQTNVCVYLNETRHFLGYNVNYGKGRELIRFPGIYNSIEFASSVGLPRITYYQYYVPTQVYTREVKAYSYNNTWHPFYVTYNNATFNHSTSIVRSATLLSASGTAPVKSVLDLTEFAQKWKADSIDGAKGLLLMNDDETNANQCVAFMGNEVVNTQFYYYAPYVVMDYSPITYRFRNAGYTVNGSATYLSVNNGRDMLGMNIYATTTLSHYGAQDFKLVYDTDYYAYRLKPLCSMNGRSRCVDIKRINYSIVSGCEVKLHNDYDLDGDPGNSNLRICQLFVFQRLADNKYKILVKENQNLCLAVVSGGDVKVATVSSNSANQEWYFEYTDSNSQEAYYSNMNLLYPFVEDPSYRVSYGFARRNSSDGVKMHKGIDISTVYNTDLTPNLYSPFKGKIAAIYDNHPELGNAIAVEATEDFNNIYKSGDKLIIIFMHMSVLANYSVGNNVDAGAYLGKVGNTGDSNGYHLHYGVSIGGTYISGGEQRVHLNENVVINPLMFYPNVIFTFVGES